MEDSRIKIITLWTKKTEKDFSTLEAMIRYIDALFSVDIFREIM